MRVDCDVRNLSLCGKIFVTQEVPSNEIFSICASLFAIGMPIWMMASGFVEEKSSRYKKLIHITKYIYAPFILLEIYSMSVRVKAYGLTEQRYAAWMFILLQVIYILWEKIYARYARLAGRKKHIIIRQIPVIQEQNMQMK